MIYKDINGQSMTPSEIKKYLDRIEIESPKELNLEYLTRLQKAHSSHIPFENLDIMGGKPLSLNRDVLFKKMIIDKRGGVCSEINTLYNWLLESLGYDVTSYISRIIATTLPYQTESHRIMGIRINDKIYITDAGFNFEHHRIPLLLEENLVQNDEECEYKFIRDDFWGWVMLQGRKDMGWRKKIGFTQVPHIDLDYVPATFYAQYHPDSKINKALKASLYIDGEFYAIRSNQFLIEHNGIPTVLEEINSKEQEATILKEVFHLNSNIKDIKKL